MLTRTIQELTCPNCKSMPIKLSKRGLGKSSVLMIAIFSFLVGGAPITTIEYGHASESFNSQIFQTLDELNFNSPIGRLEGGAVFKWVTPVHILLLEQRPPEFVDFLTTYASQLSVISGHEIRNMENLEELEDVNLMIILSDSIFESALGKYRILVDKVIVPNRKVSEIIEKERRKKSKCFSRAGIGEGQITIGITFVSSEQSEEEIRKCLTLDIFRHLGFFGSTKILAESILVKGSPYTQLTPADNILLRVFYDK